MSEKKETTHLLSPHLLVIFIRPRSSVWQCRYQVDGKWQRESTKERDLAKAKLVAHDLLVEANVRKKLKAAPITRKFKDIARQAILRMEKAIEDGEANTMYKEYIVIIEKYLITFFGNYKIDSISHQLLEQFSEWREKRMGSEPKHSTVLNHNAALNRVFDEGVYRGYMFEMNRPKLVVEGKKSERRPAFTVEEAGALVANFDSWIEQARADSYEIRKLLRDLVIILLDTGIRPGTEIYGLTWGQINIVYSPSVEKIKKNKKYIDPNEPPEDDDNIWINPNSTAEISIRKGKTGSRNCIGRSPSVGAFRSIAKRNFGLDLNEVIKKHPNDKIIKYKEYVSERQSNSQREAKSLEPTSLYKLFDTYLKEHNLLIDPVTNKNRVLYSLRHTYATNALQYDNVDIHTLAIQMGTSVAMIEQHYSHLEAFKVAHQLRGDRSRELIQAHGVISDRYKWDESKAKSKMAEK